MHLGCALFCAVIQMWMLGMLPLRNPQPEVLETYGIFWLTDCISVGQEKQKKLFLTKTEET